MPANRVCQRLKWRAFSYCPDPRNGVPPTSLIPETGDDSLACLETRGSICNQTARVWCEQRDCVYLSSLQNSFEKLTSRSQSWHPRDHGFNSLILRLPVLWLILPDTRDCRPLCHCCAATARQTPSNKVLAVCFGQTFSPAPSRDCRTTSATIQAPETRPALLPVRWSVLPWLPLLRASRCKHH